MYANPDEIERKGEIEIRVKIDGTEKVFAYFVHFSIPQRYRIVSFVSFVKI